MLGWRRKIVKFLVIYFAGFATAIYAIVPGSADNQQDVSAAGSNSFIASFLKSDDFAISFREQIDRTFELGKIATCKLGDLLRQEYSTGTDSGQKL
jgi:hypothetical protein